MKIAYRWLLDYVNTSLNPEELGDRFVYTSSELESLTNWSDKYRGIVVGFVITAEKHPQADKLKVTTVQTGDKIRTIVCGAPNVAAGQKVPVALPGSTVHGSNGKVMEIGEAVLRGVKSEGMICSAAELGISADNSGILVLDTSAAPGTPFAEAAALNDSVLDLEITPNRPDLLSYIGLAREVATFDKKRLIEPPLSILEELCTCSNPIHASIADSHLCQRYSAIYLENIQVKPSPLWMQSRLLLSGLKPINNIVDTLNYVMVELGQPLHAFDFEKLPALKSNRKEITARPADEGEVMLGLDGVLYTMKYGDIVIVDSLNTPIALAGIIGGQDSAISDSTTKVVIEAATFLGPQIRRTSRAHGVRTEASTRFEKGLDPELTVRALKRVVYLLNEQFGEIRCSQITDVYPSSKREIPRLHVTFDEVQQVIGVHISSAETKVILQKLGFQISHFSKSSFAVSPPTWRADIKLKEDIIEELVRIWGYDRIPATLPSGPVKAPIPNQSFVRKQQVRHLLAQLGGHETIHQTLCSLDALKRSGYSADQAISIPHPLSQETEHLIPSHLVPFLQNLGGVNSLETEITLFEIGHVFMPPYAEDERLSIIWRSSGEGELLYQRAKMALARLSGVLQLPTDFTFNYPEQGGEYPAALEGKSVVEILSASAVVGHLGLLKTSVLDAWKIRSGRTMLFMELSLKNILAIPSKPRLFVEPPLFPGSERDLSFVVDRSLAVALVEQAVQDAMDTTICQSAKITNIYTGKPIPDDKKSVTFHFTYNALTRTLTDEEIQKDQDTVIKALHRLFSSTIRQ